MVSLAYDFAPLGAFVVEAFQRRRGTYRSSLLAFQAQANVGGDDLEL